MTAQEAFTTVVAHLRKQGMKSWTFESGCMYRSPNGLKCAVGALIPDDLYTPDMEGYVVETINVFPAELIDLLSDLQYTHDQVPPGKWELEFRSLANKHNLILENTNV